MESSKHARKFISDLRIAMERRACNQIDAPRDRGQTPMMSVYGDTWKLIYGIVSGIDKMRAGQEAEYDLQKGEMVTHGVSDDIWQEHYDEYGYGPYGDGLEIGKRMAFRSETEFNFIEPDEPEESDEGNKFTFVR